MMLARFLLAVGCAVLALPAWSQTPAAADDNTADDMPPWVQPCLKATEPAAMKACIQQMAGWVSLTLQVEVSTRRVLRGCLNLDDAGMRECVASIAHRPDSPAERRATALDKALRGWEVATSQSRLGGPPAIYLTLDSEDEIENAAGRRERAKLTVRCQENTTSVFVRAEGFYLTEDVPFAYRIDTDKAVAQTWRGSTNNKAAGLWDGGRAIPFIKSLLGRSTLIVRVTPFRDAPREMAFNIAGLDQHIGSLREACKW